MAHSIHRPILNLDAIGSSVWRCEPFPWTRYSAAIQSTQQAQLLRDSFPQDAFTRFSRESGSKRHRLCGRRFRSGDKHSLARLPEPWRQFCDDAYSPAYRSTMEAAADVALEECGVEITLWRHGPGDFIDPHVDHEAKVLVHLIYFSSPDWRSGDGGCLRILRSKQMKDLDAEIEPRLGEALIFKRSATSWHGYPPVTRPDEPRLAAQIVFHEQWLRYADETSSPDPGA